MFYVRVVLGFRLMYNLCTLIIEYMDFLNATNQKHPPCCELSVATLIKSSIKSFPSL
jgi:hypothetical protein